MLKARRDVRTPIGNCNDMPVMSAIGVYVQTSGSVFPSFFQQMNLLRTIIIWYRRPVAVLPSCSSCYWIKMLYPDVSVGKYCSVNQTCF